MAAEGRSAKVGIAINIAIKKMREKTRKTRKERKKLTQKQPSEFPSVSKYPPF